MKNHNDLILDKNHINQVDLKIATVRSRIGNSIIDSLSFYFLYLALLSVSWTIFKKDIENDPILDLSLLLLSHVLVYSVTEYLFQKTLGKFLTRTKVVTLNGEKPGFKTILGRTFCRLIPCEAFSFLILENGIHDKFSNTRVVNE